jgi:hypothetical protein
VLISFNDAKMTVNGRFLSMNEFLPVMASVRPTDGTGGSCWEGPVGCLAMGTKKEAHRLLVVGKGVYYLFSPSFAVDCKTWLKTG